MITFRSVLFLSIFTISSFTLTSQTKHYTGEWTKIGTKYVFEFNLHLEHEGEQVSGYFDWKITKLDKDDPSSVQYYKNKIGSTAREYKKGTYHAKQREYRLKGYKKNDPNQIISTDTYRLRIDDSGNIGGDTNANGSWLGRINGSAVSVGPV